MILHAHVGGNRFDFELSSEGRLIRVGEFSVVLDDQSGNLRTAFVDERRIDFGWARHDGTYDILIDGLEYRVEIRDARAELAAQFSRSCGSAAGDAVVTAPIPGLISKVLVAEGDRVAKDQPLLTLDAMKLENELAAPREGVVKSVKVKAGTAVDKGQALIVIG